MSKNSCFNNVFIICILLAVTSGGNTWTGMQDEDANLTLYGQKSAQNP
jgi:hypothetical protein